MGGYGSGRRWGRDKKTTVEDGLVLNVHAFKTFMDSGPGSVGTVTWSRGEAVFASISAGVKSEGEDVTLRFHYTHGSGENAQAVDYTVRMVKAVPYFGGVRWYFLCPLVHEGKPCLRRVSKLYLPPGGLYFGCRECYGLTYTSSQESHKFDGLYKRVWPIVKS